MVEARARLGRRAGDFAEWIRTSLGLPELAERIERIDTYMTSLERVRARVLGLVDAALELESGARSTSRIDDYRQVAAARRRRHHPEARRAGARPPLPARERRALRRRRRRDPPDARAADDRPRRRRRRGRSPAAIPASTRPPPRCGAALEGGERVLDRRGARPLRRDEPRQRQEAPPRRRPRARARRAAGHRSSRTGPTAAAGSGAATSTARAPQRRAWSVLPAASSTSTTPRSSRCRRFGRRLGIPQYVIHPSIDPLSEKNRDLPPREVAAHPPRPRRPPGPAAARADRRASRAAADPAGRRQRLPAGEEAPPRAAGRSPAPRGDEPESVDVAGRAARGRARTTRTSWCSSCRRTRSCRSTRSSARPPSCSRSRCARASGSGAAEAMWKGKPVVGGFAGGLPPADRLRRDRLHRALGRGRRVPRAPPAEQPGADRADGRGRPRARAPLVPRSRATSPTTWRSSST